MLLYICAVYVILRLLQCPQLFRGYGYLLFIQEHGRTENRFDAVCDRTAHAACTGSSVRPRGNDSRYGMGFARFAAEEKQMFRGQISIYGKPAKLPEFVVKTGVVL